MPRIIVAVFKFTPSVRHDTVLRLLRSVVYSDFKPSLYASEADYLHQSLFGEEGKSMSRFAAAHSHSKATDWSYEKEIRVFVPNMPGRRKFDLHYYYAEELTEIYPGYKMDEATRRLIAHLARQRNPAVAIYQMIKHETDNDYRLNATPL